MTVDQAGLTVGITIRAVINAVIAGLLISHAIRHRTEMIEAKGSRYPTVYLWFGIIFLLRASEAFSMFFFHDPPIVLRMASDLAAIVTIDRLWRSQDQSVALWKRAGTKEGDEFRRILHGVRDAAEAMRRKHERDREPD